MLTPVAPSELAAIVTSLEMRARPSVRPFPASPLRLARWRAPTPDAYRTLFRRVGAPWLWFSRLLLSDADLGAIIHDDAVEIHAVLDPAGIEVGLLELDFHQAGQCEIAFFGLVPELAGQGQGRWLMAQALMLGWRRDVERLWVHTCTLDHPSALNFYRAQGFTPFARMVETFADPRLLGALPRDCAPQIPLLDPPS
ncbi:GNAT family N-acetyltransferase [uncultured Sphingomonas sp.]|mgnify:CR=1 FL=1|uniref:GNAT family N-acetyltransferase n=1 Tax=uncultured Sphingomonas sp. TaxID=158754 RepID=UPI0025DD5BB1|nr:GNAT family N-acetyltransferase [uncultured Sphingomonas sp.]